LGDGDARNAMIHAGFVDGAEIARRVRECGYVVSESVQRTATRMYVTTPDSRTGPRADSVVGRLRRLGLLQDKHIPERYLRAGTAQRLALMQGLMDSDGHVSRRGDCIFVNTCGPLVEGFVELARSLGFVPSVRWREDNRQGSYLRVAKVAFQADHEMLVFRLERKRARLRPVRLARHTALAVVSVEPVDSTAVQCLAVDAPDRLYRAGEGMVVTHNTHRLVLDHLKRAWAVMLANLAKRPIAQPWALETTTAPEPGVGSVAEATMDYALEVAKQTDPSRSRLFFFHREASAHHDLSSDDGLRSAILEASGPYIAGWTDVERIRESFREPDADRAYLERVWLNRPVQASAKAFDIDQWRALRVTRGPPPKGAMITLGFDGSRYDDATALVGTEIPSGHQWVLGVWERPPQQQQWEVPVREVDGAVADAFGRWKVLRMYADPPKWEGWVATWAGRYGDKVVVEWWTNRRKPMAYAIRSFVTAIAAGEVSHDGDPRLDRHLGNACRLFTNLVDEQEKRLWILRKERPDSPHKIDLAMAAILSHEAASDAIATGLGPKRSVYERREPISV